MQNRLKEIQAKVDLATNGEWIYDERVGCVAVYKNEQVNCMSELREQDKIYYKNGYLNKNEQWEVDQKFLAEAQFIANAPTDIKFLMAALQEEQAELSKIKKDFNKEAEFYIKTTKQAEARERVLREALIKAVSMFISTEISGSGSGNFVDEFEQGICGLLEEALGQEVTP